MKETLIAVVIFCLLLILVTVFSTLAFAVHLLGSRLFLFPVVTPEMLLTVIPAALRYVFLPSVLLSLFFALTRARRKPGPVFLSYILLGALAFAALYGGPRLAVAPLEAQITRVHTQNVLRPRDLDYPRRLIPLKGAFLYFDRKEGATLADGFFVDTDRPSPRVITFDRARLTYEASGTMRLALPQPAGNRVLEPLTAESALFVPDAAAGTIFGFFTALNERYLVFAGEQTAAAAVLSFVFVFVFLSSSVFLRATRWPLANVFLTLLILALVLFFYNSLITLFLVEAKKLLGESFWTGLAPRGSPLASIFGESFWSTAVPNAVLVFISLSFVLVDFVFLPERKEEAPRA